MRLVILGAGALGAYFGSRFQEAGADVTFLVREKRAEQLKEEGLKIHSKQGDYEVNHFKVEIAPENIPSADIVVVGVKGYHLEGTFEQLDVLVKKGAFILPVLNGIEHIDVLQERYGHDRVLGGLAFIIATLDENGHVVHSSNFHDLVFGALDPKQEQVCEQLDDLATKANMDAKNSPAILQELWKKYMFINAFSGITTAVNLPIGPIRDQKPTFHLAKMILHEMKLLANSYGAKITDTDAEKAINNLLHLDKEATSSMHQDRRKGLTLEVEHLHGGALRLAEKQELSLPYIEAIYGTIKPYEHPAE
ncbi:ketopantoate reductase family protein [Virgibacillus sp. SK37]|uniref:ketopantoate reductase family protein n=1 Tax=Virgibacillus sp. SK37 TaxID=403957 RepID=UPI0004D13B7D|nr:2-dehydropantoate 2-reductase [Virgibacillus sp. SK37]AIF42330.1 2-dehydropantoate 2-reductase [Virgibacillus sp. SK37]